MTYYLSFPPPDNDKVPHREMNLFTTKCNECLRELITP